MNKFNGKLDFEVEDWSKIKYIVTCHNGVHVDNRYPQPVVNDYHFETFNDMENFVSDYILNNGSLSKKIIMIKRVDKIYRVETYEVATKVRVVPYEL